MALIFLFMSFGREKFNRRNSDRRNNVTFREHFGEV